MAWTDEARARSAAVRRAKMRGHSPAPKAKPFTSQAQWKFAFASGFPWARERAQVSPPFKKLPKYVPTKPKTVKPKAVTTIKKAAKKKTTVKVTTRRRAA